LELRRKRNQSDSIIFNGHDLSSLVYCKVRRPIMASVNATFEDVPGRHGEVFKTAKRAGYDLSIDMWLRTEHRREVAEARHRLAAMLWTDEPAPLFLPDDPTRYLMAIVSGSTDLDEITDDCPTTTVTFHIGDPDYYGQSRRVEAAGTAAFAVGGNLPAALRVTAKPGTCDAWRITNADTGEFVEVAQALTSDSVIRLDFASEKATVNSSIAALNIMSDFFEVKDRAHLTISSGTATIEWGERWL
jgi:predicted phage tail component-like protein